ncbi:phage baseplate protein [Providencia sp. wls1921]|uniref:phage baseplate protein n=1 Tax=Providencia sp. wls1921 TaxID=2675153 RepID=UPI0012B59948|nr:phage tail protein [Providencia sp. wls1921]MTC40818.1 phage tail protein [Providencia sp. wls1921]
MTKIFKIPFATQGDRTSIPNEVQADGSVSYPQGYGYDYERDQVSDPAAKDIEREKMNSMFHDITEAVGEIQNYGFSKWAEGGKPYPIRAVVYHKNKVWQSKVENNEVEPVAGAQWVELKADLTAGDINVYNKTESDKRFQPLGNYLPAGYSYSKQESDTNFQPKGNYAPVGNYALKGESYTKVEGDGRYQPKGNYLAAGYSYSKAESDGRYQAKGNYQPSGDYATNTALTNGLNTKLNTSNVAQGTGTSTTNVMSQNAVTVALQNAVNLNTIYPIGIVVWFAQNKNPNTLFPGTKWQYIGENKTIRLAAASGANVLSTGGSDSVTLTETQMPAHNHSFSATTNNTGGHTHDRGTMDITGDFPAIRKAAQNRDSSLKGAFAILNKWNASNSWSGTDDDGTVYNFTASRSWTGATSNNGAHAHTVSGTTGNKGGGTAVNITNAYIMLMGWYRIS